MALVAGGAAGRSVLLGLSMTLLQFAIGTLNDLVDAERDRGRRGKAVALGVVSPRAARALIGVCVAGGLALSLAGGPGLLLLALVGLALGAWYDLAAKGTRLSWLPLALGVPILPVYGWYGATGSLPPAFGVLVPAAALAGAALAIANAAVDIERDRAAGIASLASALGPVRAAVVGLAIQVAVAGLAVISASQLGAAGTWFGVAVGAALIPVAAAVFGVVAARLGPAYREVAFELQAVGLALLAVAWVNAIGTGVA